MSHVASPLELTGQTAVVTGSSSGIGRAIALELAAAGANVVVHARQSKAAADEVSSEIRGRGVESRVVMADLGDPSNHEPFVKDCWEWRGDIDIWVNNAGVDVLTGKTAGWPFERKLEALWRVDVMATIRLSRLVGARMAARQRGVILNMGWDQAEAGMAGESGEMFAAVKGAVMAFTKSLARSLAPHVRVNCLAPGWIKTAWGENASAAWQERAVQESLLARWGTPEDVANAARFLASPAAGFMTGQTVSVNGGRGTA